MNHKLQQLLEGCFQLFFVTQKNASKKDTFNDFGGIMCVLQGHFYV